MTKHLLAALACAFTIFPSHSQDKEEDGFSRKPEIHGTVRAKYEYEPQISSGRFEVRNARVSVSGRILPIVDYKAEIDLSDEGKIKMLDAYGRLSPWKGVAFTIGQMRVPFTIDAHRSPHQQFFANRSFIAKQVSNVRDVGLMASYKTGGAVPLVLEGGIFNGSGLTDQKDFWTGTYNFSVKVQAELAGCVNLTAGCQRACPDKTRITMWNIGSFYKKDRWHVEAEYLHKAYSHGAFRAVNAVDVFGCYSIPLRKKVFSSLSVLGRYDYMSDHSNGYGDEQGKLVIDDHARQRLTGGLTLRIGKMPVQADIRLNYEKYFYHEGVEPGVSDRDKIVLELMCRF